MSSGASFIIGLEFSSVNDIFGAVEIRSTALGSLSISVSHIAAALGVHGGSKSGERGGTSEHQQNCGQKRKCTMARDVKPAKRPYTAPAFQVLDATAAKAELEAKGESKDENVQRMFSLIDKQPKKKKRFVRGKKTKSGRYRP